MMDRPDPDHFDLDALARDLGCPPDAPLAMPKQQLQGPLALVRPLPMLSLRVAAIRAVALLASLTAAAAAFLLFLQYGAADGLDWIDLARAGLILLTTWWLAWGAVQASVGLLAGLRPLRRGTAHLRGRTVVIVPVYNEDPVSTFARIAAMEDSLAATGEGARFAFAILSDTRDEDVAAQERLWFLRLLRDTGGEGRMFYRRRADNHGRKAGNIEAFLTRSGGAYDHALILDADSLMEGDTIVEMVRRMEANPRLGLLQTLPMVIRARARFGRAQQFSASAFAPVFARGQAVMQGYAGPFWGHNALVRVAAFAEACGLPELPGAAPFGGAIMSHDYVEAAMLARAGWQVRLDEDLDGSFEEGPETLIDHAKRDRRWCQGNLQHLGVIGAAGLRTWSRFTFFQGIFAYVAPLFWLGFLALSILAAITAPLHPDYFRPENPIPVFPIDMTGYAITLGFGIFGLLFLPKLLIALDAIRTGRAAGFGGSVAMLRGTMAEVVLSSLTAPIFLMFQTRAVLQVLMGRDGGWPAQSREGGRLSLATSWAATNWMVAAGAAGLGATLWWAPGLTLWLVPVLIPMMAAPVLVALLSGEDRSALFRVPAEFAPSPVLRRHARILRAWRGTMRPGETDAAAGVEAAGSLYVPELRGAA